MKLAAVALVAGCSVPSVDLNGKACPCPSPYLCNQATQTCALALSDARANDTPKDSSFSSDALPGVSCLNAPLSHPIYASPAFGDFGAAWTSFGGSWSVSAGELDETNGIVQLAYAHHLVAAIGGAGYRVVASMRQVGNGSLGGALELAARIDATKSSMYHCNFEPNDGFFLIQHTDSGVGGGTLTTTTLNVPDALGSYMMEFQVIGTGLECCVRGVTGAHLNATDGLYTTGEVGVKSYEMAAAFKQFAVYD